MGAIAFSTRTSDTCAFMVGGKNTKRYFRMKTEEGMELSSGNSLPGFNMSEPGSMLTTEKLAFDKTNVKPGQH